MKIYTHWRGASLNTSASLKISREKARMLQEKSSSPSNSAIGMNNEYSLTGPPNIEAFADVSNSTATSA